MSDISYFKEWIQDNWTYTRGYGLPYDPYVTHQIDGLSYTQPTPNSKEH